MRWNPRRRRDPGHRTPLPPESEDQRWGAIVAHLSALTGTMTDIADESRSIPVPDRQRLRDFGHVLAQLATACHTRGDLSCRPMADDNAHRQLSENLAGLERYHTDLHKKPADEQSVSTSTIAVLGTLLIQAQTIWHEIVPEHRPPNISPSGRPGQWPLTGSTAWPTAGPTGRFSGVRDKERVVFGAGAGEPVPGGDQGSVDVACAGGGAQRVGDVVESLPRLRAAVLGVQGVQGPVWLDEVGENRGVGHDIGRLLFRVRGCTRCDSGCRGTRPGTSGGSREPPGLRVG